MDHLLPQAIRTGLPPGQIGTEVLVLQTVGSTNDAAAQYARDPHTHGLAILTEHQTQGRGRQGRTWTCGHGQGILCSVLFGGPRLKTELIQAAAALATAQAIGPQATIKWPNDIMVGGGKVAGILIERKAAGDGGPYVIGIGINCNQGIGDLPDHIQARATSLAMATGRPVDRNTLAKRLLTCLQQWMEAAGDCPNQVLATWRQRCTHLGHHLGVRYGGKVYTGTCIGLDMAMGLVLQLDQGGIRFFPSTHSHILDQAEGLKVSGY